MGAAAPLWICFLAQGMSVLGDAFGQRSARIYHKNSRRHFIIALTSVSCLQMFFVLGAIQLAQPDFTLVIWTKNSTAGGNAPQYDYCSVNPTSEYCFHQGPLTLYRAVDHCPALLANECVNVFYYIGEAILYAQPLGLILIVMAALSSAFIISPLQNWFHIGSTSSIPVAVILMGIVGAILCLVEREPPAGQKDLLNVVPDGASEDDSERTPTGKAHGTSQGPNEPRLSFTPKSRGSGGDRQHHQQPILTGNEAEENEEEAEGDSTPIHAFVTRRSLSDAIQQIQHSDTETGDKPIPWYVTLRRAVPLLIPFSLLSVTYAVYFILMAYYNDNCYQNAWGYNAFDQVAMPPFIWAVFFFIDSFDFLRTRFESSEDQKESFRDAVRGTFTELTSKYGAGLWTCFTYRGLVNARAIIYTYLAIQYDLNQVYLQLTLIRVALSWVGSVVLVLAVPKFIQTSQMERTRILDPMNIVFKILGSAFIVTALLLMQ